MPKKRTPKTTVATTNKPIGDDLPSYLTGDEKVGLDGMGTVDLVVPRIKLLQGTSNELDTFDDAKRGNFWHNVMDLSLGDTFKFVVCRTAKRYTLLAPIGDTRVVLARAIDGVHWQPKKGEFKVKPKWSPNDVIWKLAETVEESGLHLFGSSIPGDPDSNPAAVMSYDYLSLLPDHLELGVVVISAARSQVRVVKRQLNSKIEMFANRNVPMQALVFQLTAVKENGEEGDFFNYQIAMAGHTEEALFKRALDVRDRFNDFQGQGSEFEQESSAEGDTEERAKAKGI